MIYTHVGRTGFVGQRRGRAHALNAESAHTFRALCGVVIHDSITTGGHPILTAERGRITCGSCLKKLKAISAKT